MTEVEVSPLHGEGRTFGRLAGLRGELMAEFFGMFVLIALGDGVVAMAVAALPRLRPHRQLGHGRRLAADHRGMGTGRRLRRLGGGRRAPGAHLNPAVTLGLAVRRRFPWRKLLPYWGAQVTGAFAGAALVFLVYRTAINAFDLANGTPERRERAGYLLDLRYVSPPGTSAIRSGGR